MILLGIEARRPDGWPAVPVVAVLLLHVHSVGFWLLVTPPDWLPGGDVLTAAAGWLQPGLWGTLLLVGLATARVLGGALAGEGRRIRAGSP